MNVDAVTADDVQRESPGEQAKLTNAGSDARDLSVNTEASILEIANVIVKRWKVVLGPPVIIAFLAAIVVLLLPAQYAASTAFVPEVESERVGLPSSLAGLTGFASQFGFNLGASATSPDFYSYVLRSRTIADETLLTRFPDPHGLSSDSALLIDILGIRGLSQPKRFEAGRKRLQRLTSIDIDYATSVIRVNVVTAWPELSATLANHYVQLVNRFNLERRHSNAGEKRRFIEIRLTHAEEELRDSEETFKEFLESNRTFQDSPGLRFTHERLERQVSIKEEVLTTLKRQYEEARIQEVNDTPVITVVDVAVAPAKRHRPRRKLFVITAFVVASVLSTFLAFAFEYLQRAQTLEREQYDELRSSLAALLTKLRLFTGRRSPRRGGAL